MRCYACDAVLQPEGYARGRKSDAPVLVNGEPYADSEEEVYQLDNALWLSAGGGYGMFIESPAFMGENWPPEIVVCHECAHAACDKIPWLDRWLDPVHSHAHRHDCIEANPNHVGWDYRNCCDGHIQE